MRQKQFLLAFLAMLLCFAAPSFAQNVAKIKGGTEYAKLSDAITAATAGQTIELIADVNQNVTISKSLTIDGAGKTYTGKMTLKAGATITNVNFDGKGYNGYAVQTDGADYVTIEHCTAKSYGYGFVQLASGTVLTTVKNVTVSNMNYGVKVDYSNAVVLENVDITAGVAAVLNSNYGGKTITVKNSKLNILGTWTRNNTIKTDYVFEGENTIDSFIIDAAIDNFKLAAGATLTAPEEITVNTDVENYEVIYKDGKYTCKEISNDVVMIGEQGYETLAAAIKAATAGQTITLCADLTENVTINKSLTIDGAGKTFTGNIQATNKTDVVIKNVNFDGKGNSTYAVEAKGAYNITVENSTVKNYTYGFLQNANGTVSTTVKNVTIEGVNYGVKVDYANEVLLKNVKMINVKNGILNSNYGAKTITIKDSELTSLNIWERNQTIYTTFKFEGKNTISAFPTSTLVKYEGVILGNKAYGELTDALAEVDANDVLNIYSNYTIANPINVAGNLTINGNGKTLTYTGSGADARAITVESTANGANLTINNLIVDCTASYCQRGINYNTNGTLKLDGVTVKGKNVTYALNLPGSSDNANVTINNSSLTGNIALNVWGENSVINATNTVFTAVDNNTVEGYAAVKLNNDGTTSAEGTVINIEGGKIGVTGTACTDTEAVSNATSTGQINISDSTTVNGDVATMVAVIRYADGNSYSFTNLTDAIAKAEVGDVVTMIRDVTMSEILTVNKAITLDGNGNTLKSTAGRAINVDNADGATIKNLTINASGERAINVINNATNVTVEGVTATAANYTVNLAASAANAVVAIKASNLTGLNVVNVAAAGAKVTVDGTTLVCNDQNANESYAAIAVNKESKNATVVVTNSKFDIKGDSAKVSNGAEGATITIDGVEAGNKIVAVIEYEGTDNYYSFETLEAAIAKAEAGDVVTIIRDVTMSEILTVNKAITLDGNGNTLKSTAGRAINVSGADGVTIKNLTIDAKGERAINVIQNATNVTIENVTATAANYTVNLAASAPNAVVAINNSTLNGLCTVNVSAAGANVTVDESTINCNDYNTTAGEAYAALSLNKDAVGGKIIATNTTVNVTEGSDSVKGRNGAKDGEVTINGSAEGVVTMVACITYEGSDYYHAFATLQAAIDFAKAGETVKLIADATGAGVVIDKDITIDFNDKTYSFNEGVGSTGTKSNGFQILKGNDVILMNGSLNVAESAKDKFYILVQNYANLTVNGMNLDGTNLDKWSATDGDSYVLSNNCGTVNVSGSTITANNDGALAYALDACLKAPYEAPVVNVAEGSTINGNVEVSATLNMNGTLNGNIIINGAEGVVNATKEYNVTTTLANSKVVYAEGKYSIAEAHYVAQVGEAKYETLAEAVKAAQAGATVELLADVTLKGGNEKDAEAGLVIDKAMTLDGKGHTIDCGTFVKGIRIYGPSALTDIKINNVTIVNNKATGRCVDTRSGNLRLKFNNANLIAHGTNSQPLTVGGNEKLHQIDLSGCTIDAGNSGYGIISFVPTSQAIKVMNSTVKGYAGIYLKGDGTKVTITTNSEVIGKNVHSGATNAFGAVVFEGNNNVVNINATSPMLKAIAEGDQAQAAIMVKSGSGNNVVLETNKGAEILAEGENAYWAMVSAEATGTTITKDGVAVALQAECDGIQFLTLEDALRYSKDNSTVKLLANVALDTKKLVAQNDGYATLINVKDKAITLDLNGKTINVAAAASDLANTKGGMLLSVFHADTNGQLTLADNSEAQRGAVIVKANDAKIYCLAASESQYTDKTNSGKIIVNGGTYTLDKAADSMFFSDANEVITINGGNFTLGNVGTGSNGMPWIFNTYERNERHVNVYGGTFNADINHQYWAFEVNVPNNRALRYNGEEAGTWTVVDAEAWVLEKYNANYNREVGYATLEEAIAVSNNVNNTVTLVKDVEVVDMITVANGKTLVLNLNGKTLSAIDNTSKNYSLIDNRGELTITGEGVMTVEATVNSGWNRYSAVIANNPGGKLTVNGGTIEHLGGTDMAYGIDNLTNGKGTYAETIINGGTIKSPYRAIRQFLNGVEADNILTVNGGTIEGANKSIWMQDPSKNANTGSLTVGEEASLNGNVYLTVTAGSTEWPVKVKIAKAALEGESKVLSSNVPEGYAVSEYPTYWTVEALNLAELTIKDACTSYVNVAEKNVGKLTYVRNFENTEWQTLYLPFAVPAANLMDEFEVAYIYNASYKGNVAAIDYVVVGSDYTLQANYPYLIRAKEAGVKSIEVENAKLMPTAVNSINCSSVFETFEFTGSYTTVEGEPCADATAEAHASKGHFVMNDGAWKRFYSLNPFRVYLTITLRNGSDFLYPTEESIIMRKVDKNGNVDTSVEKIGVDADILGIYDLQGRRVLEPQKGEIYIINGKKVVF